MQKIIRCKNCKHYQEDVWASSGGVPFIAAHDICRRWADGCKTNPDGYCHMAEPIYEPPREKDFEDAEE